MCSLGKESGFSEPNKTRISHPSSLRSVEHREVKCRNELRALGHSRPYSFREQQAATFTGFNTLKAEARLISLCTDTED